MQLGLEYFESYSCTRLLSTKTWLRSILDFVLIPLNEIYYYSWLCSAADSLDFMLWFEKVPY